MKKIQTVLSTKLLAVMSSLLVLLAVLPQAPISSAAGLPSIRLISPALDGVTNSYDDSAGVIQFYTPGVRQYATFIEYGTTLNLTYKVTQADGTTPWADKPITIEFNSKYSCSKAKWTIGGKEVGPSFGGDTFPNGVAGFIGAGTTNSKGEVSFTIVNTDTAASPLEDFPLSKSDTRLKGANGCNTSSGAYTGTAKTFITGLTDTQQDQDITIFHVTKKPTEAQTPKIMLPSVRLLSPSYDATNSIDVTRDIKQFFSIASTGKIVYIPAGTTITFKYQVSADGVNPAPVGTEVSLYINSQYSASNANWKASDGTVIGSQALLGGTSSSKPGGTVTAKTDASGQVSFTVTNTDTVGLEPIPTSPTQPIASIQGARLFGTFKAFISTITDDTKQDSDLITFDITQSSNTGSTTPVTPTPTASATPTVAPKGLPSMRLISPAYGPTNSVDTSGDIAQYYSAKTRAYYTYIAAGTSLTLKYLVTKDGTTPLANTEVTLQINSPYSMSKANWIVGSKKIGIPASDSASGADLKATTNAAGEVTFTLKNTDTTGTEAAPATPNSAAPKARLYGTFKPVITGYGDKDADVDIVSFDIYAVAVKATTITCIKGKTTKKVTAVKPKCPTGYKKK